jgi:hypothetical protein
MKEKEISPHPLFDINDLNNIILEYTMPEGFDSTGWSLEKHRARSRLSLFESRLPVVTLLQHVVNGEKDQVQAILDQAVACSKDQKNPELLRELLVATGTVIDHAGRKHKNRTAYQLAIGAHDYNVDSYRGPQVVDGIVEMLICYFKKLTDGEALWRQQHHAQLPNGYQFSLLSAELEQNPENAQPSEIYLSETGKYLVRSPEGAVKGGIIQGVKMTDLSSKLMDHSFKLAVLKKIASTTPQHILSGADKLEEKIVNDSREFKRVIDAVVSVSNADCQQTMLLDSFHGYYIRRDHLEIHENKLFAGEIYLTKTENGLAYRTRGLDGKIKLGNIVWSQLPPCGCSVDEIMKNNYRYLPAILEQVANAGYIYTAEQVKALHMHSHATVKAITPQEFNENFQQLQSYIETILHKSLNFNLLKALYRFRNYLEPKEVCTIGSHFNSQLLKDVSKCFENNFLRFGNQHYSPKNVLCCQKIVGLIQRLLPACEAQVFDQSLNLVAGIGEWPLRKVRRTFLWADGSRAIFPLDSDPVLRLGYNCMWENGPRASIIAVPNSMSTMVNQLISSKNNNAAEIMQQSSLSCTIM